MQDELCDGIETSAMDGSASEQRGHDNRNTQRLRTVFRVARIFTGERYGLARVLNVSDEGMMLTTQLDLSLDTVLSVDLSETCTLKGRVVWHHSGRCGLKLFAPIDSAALLKRLYDEQRSDRARQMRVRFDKAVVVQSDLGIQIMRARDVSQRGIKLVHDGRFRPGMTVKVAIAPGIERRGVVRWSQDGIAGCMLTELISVEELGSMTDPR